MQNVVQKQQVGEKVQINEQNPSVLICAYGTLRLGQGNYRAYLEGKSKHLGTFQTEPKFTMYGLHSGFPIVSTEGNTPITCDVFLISQDAVLRRVHGLEGFRGTIGAPENWYDCQPIETPYGPGYIYVQHKHIENAKNIIKNGDWLKRNLQ